MSKITAVIVTHQAHGSNDLSPVYDSMRDFDEVIIWDNSEACKAVSVFGRYAGALLARNEWVYVQDDDCVVDAAGIATQATAGRIVCNVPMDRRPEYAGTGLTLMGWGSVFAKSLIMPSFAEYLKRWPQDELFERECDRLFSYVNRRRVVLVDTGLRHLEHAHGVNRMGREARHRADMVEMRRRAMELDERFVHARESFGVEVV